LVELWDKDLDLGLTISTYIYSFTFIK